MIGAAFVDPVVKVVAAWALAATVAAAAAGGFAWWQTERIGAIRAERDAAELKVKAMTKALSEVQGMDRASAAAAARACAAEGGSAFDRGVVFGRALCGAQ